ncbi:hypothetical protein N8345_02760 [Flavobacteriaceae bacterium]|nr:hypothetical protein [Flavobacteriaceae bacterium]
MFSVSIVLWVMGSMMDLDASGADTLYTLSILPVILIVLFGIRALYENKQAKAA